MAMALTLLQLGSESREIFLFDTFEGMTAPTEFDRTASDELAKTLLEESGERSIRCVASLDDVMYNLRSTGYPLDNLRFVRGLVERTIPDLPRKPIALLRLDTDWYESTRHELEHLFPLVQNGGIIIIDDYGHWQGAK